MIVLTEARPQIQARFQKLAQLQNLLSIRLCTVLSETQGYWGLHVACHHTQFAVMWMSNTSRPRIEASITSRGSDLTVLIEAGGFYSRIYGKCHSVGPHGLGRTLLSFLLYPWYLTCPCLFQYMYIEQLKQKFSVITATYHETWNLKRPSKMPFCVISKARKPVPQNSPTPMHITVVAISDAYGVLPRQSSQSHIAASNNVSAYNVHNR